MGLGSRAFGSRAIGSMLELLREGAWLHRFYFLAVVVAKGFAGLDPGRRHVDSGRALLRWKSLLLAGYLPRQAASIRRKSTGITAWITSPGPSSTSRVTQLAPSVRANDMRTEAPPLMGT